MTSRTGCLALAVLAISACGGPPAAVPEDVLRVQSALMSVTVTVTNSSGTAQAGVIVYARRNNSNAASVTTNAQGVAFFSSLASGTYTFRTAGQGTGFWFTSTSCGTGCTSKSITVTTPVVVTVADPGGTPQANLEVLVFNASGTAVNSGWTDANGHVSLSANSGTYRFAVPGDPVDYMFYSAPTANCQIPGCTSASITWTHPVAISVVDTTGAPIAGFWVHADDPDGNSLNLDGTDEQGHTSLSVPPGTYTFYGYTPYGAEFSGDACTVPGCTSTVITVPPSTIVTVSDKSGQPVANQHVVVQNADGDPETSDDTDASGQIEWRLPLGGHRFETDYGGNTYTSGPLGSCVVAGCTSALIIVDPCTSNGQCSSGFCVAGMCCNNACAGGCGSCVSIGHLATCSPLAGGTLCRASASQCDVAESCTGTSTACPNDVFQTEGTVCDDGQVCTQSETCQAGQCRAPAQFPVIVNLPVEAIDPSGGTGIADAINNHGVIVGDHTPPSGSHAAFVYSSPGPLTEIAPGETEFYPEGINDSGVIGGTNTLPDGSDHAVRYANGVLEDLGVGGDNSVDPVSSEILGYPNHGASVGAINNANQLVGSMTVGGTTRGFRYTDGVGFEDLGSLGGGITWGWDLNDLGKVVGSSTLPSTVQNGDQFNFGHAIVFDDATGLADLNTAIDPTSGWTLIDASAIAGDYIVGSGTLAGLQRAYRLNTSTGQLDELSGGWRGTVYGGKVNSAGDLVGNGFVDAEMTEQACWIYTDQIGFKKLNDLIDPASGWDLRTAFDINENDDIVGWGYRGGVWTGYRLNLSPRTLACGSATNTCGGSAAGNICLWADGVVDVGGGEYVAVFGFQNSGSTSVHPSVNQVLIDGVVVSNWQPAPPDLLPTGSHPGAFLPKFGAGHTITWNVDGKTVSVSSPGAGSSSVPTRSLPKVPIGTSGYGVQVEGTLVTVKADLTPWRQVPQTQPQEQDEPAHGDPFHGALTGQLNVSPSGAATYTVPIRLPPGIAGMAPNLNLVYNSQGGDGLAGQGWELTGLSMIHRCPRTKVQDGLGHQVTLDDTDTDEAICLDGKRLFEQSETPGTYKAEQDDHSTITKVRDQSGTLPYAGVSFKVVTKSGETRYYGTDPSHRSRVMLVEPGFEGPVAAWVLERVMDPWGNYYDITYNSDFLNEGLRVLGIDYTGHVPTSLINGTPAGDAPTFEHVSFDYDTRPDVRQTRFGPKTLVRKHRLKTIASSAGTYRLVYGHDYDPALPFASNNDAANDNDPMLPSRLTEIDYCNGSVCMAPLKFGWDGGGYHWESAPAYAPPAAIDRIGDNQAQTHGAQFVDLDGDGRQDLVQLLGCAPAAAWRNTGSGWESRSDWLPPAGVLLADCSGTPTKTVFADANGDGLPDLVGRHYDRCDHDVCAPAGVVSVWFNKIKAGLGWVAAGAGLNFFNLDVTKPDAFLDMNGDGKVDMVFLGPRSDDNFSDLLVTVYYGTGSTWQLSSESYSLNPLRSADPTINIDRIRFTDINRDGLPDIVGTYGGFCQGSRTIGINAGTNTSNGTVWRVRDAVVCPADLPKDAHNIGDVDGDGFRDDMTFYQTTDSSGVHAGTCSGTACSCGSLTGCTVTSNCTENQNQACYCNCSALTVTQDPTVALSTGSSWTSDGAEQFVSDLGHFKPHASEQTIVASERPDFIFSLADLNADGLADAILNHSDGGEVLVNRGHGLADLEGRGSWPASAGPVVDRRVPVVPSTDKTFPSSGAEFIDLDGDGVTDLAQNAGQQIKGAWLNKFRPPVITSFPAGLAKPSVVSYAVISTADAQASSSGPVYSDPKDVDGSTTFYMAPLRVVASVSAEDGAANGTMFTTSYRYQSLRASNLGRGPQGFAKVTTIDERAAIDTNPLLHRITDTYYQQYYPYTGLPALVAHSIGHTDAAHPDTPVVLSTTTNEYCDTTVENSTGLPRCLQFGGGTAPYPAGTSLFVYPMVVIDTTVLFNGDVEANHSAGSMGLTTQYRYDADGNPKKTTVTASMSDGVCAHPADCPTHERTIQNFYDATADDVGVSTDELRRLGKPTRVFVTTQSKVPTGTELSHTTLMHYQAEPDVFPPHADSTHAIALLEKIVAPDTVSPTDGFTPTEEDTVYTYDGFGNVLSTKECAGDAYACLHGGSTSRPPRVTAVSYDPAFFSPGAGAPVSSLNYGYGRFPVRTTNAVGHVEYTAYDPVFGGLVQKTGPNGIHTCHAYDEFGQETTSTERCGTAQEQSTTTNRYVVQTGDPFGGKVVTVTHDPTGVGTWTYSDEFGRTVAIRGRSFDGGFTETFKSYDQWGRLHRETSPRISGSSDSVDDTVTDYDSIGRVRQVSRALGVVDGTNVPKVSIEATSYFGPRIHTDRNLDGADPAHQFQQPRDEIKGVLGKVVSVVQAPVDGHTGTMSYTYDADGNLTDTFDGTNSVHLEYDARGRKTLSRDPDLGQWTYVFDGFGDLVTQTDAKGQEILMTYDQLGRMVTRTDDALSGSAKTAQWVYDRAPGAGKGKLAAFVTGSDDRLRGLCTAPYGLPTNEKRAVRSFSYTAFGQIQDDVSCTDGDTFTTTYGYDSFGRQNQVTYPQVGPSRLSLSYNYTSLGFLYYVADTADGGLYWAGTARDARGQVTMERTGNGVETSKTLASATGWTLESTSVAHADSDNLIQRWTYGFDEAGNLRARTRAGGASASETFTYDSLNRLRTSQFQGAGSATVSASYTFDPLGNLLAKDGKTYTYGTCGAGPHAVCTVDGGTPFAYDENGNMTTGSGRTVSYDAANKPVHIENSTSAVDFVYGADRNRIVQSLVPVGGGSDEARTVYVGLGGTGKSMYERTTHTTSGLIEHTHFLYAGDAHGGGAFAVKVLTGQSSSSTSYYHFDHLGSVTAVSDEAGHVVSPTWAGNDASVMSYDPWGARRDPVGGVGSDPSSFGLQPGHREFTGHETIPSVGLVNMNGRVYDPVIGRFLSPDPNVQFVGDLQSYNRYSYVQNNPLRYTDPTGYFMSLGSFLTTSLEVATAIGCATGTGPLCAIGTIVLTQYGTTAALMAGASFDQVVLSNSVGIAAGAIGGFAGQIAMAGLGGGISTQIAAGAISGVVSNVLATTATHGSLGLENLLVSAATGAVAAGLNVASEGTNPVSQASAERSDAYHAATPRDDDPVICGKGSVKCGGQLKDPSDTDKLVLRDADGLKRLTNEDDDERGRDLFKKSAKGNPEHGDVVRGNHKHVDVPKAKSPNIDLGFEHTHPKGPGNTIFSYADIKDLTAGQRAYLISLNGQVQVFDKTTNTIWEVRPGTGNPTELHPKREFLLP